jgi:hypothetical protein
MCADWLWLIHGLQACCYNHALLPLLLLQAMSLSLRLASS